MKKILPFLLLAALLLCACGETAEQENTNTVITLTGNTAEVTGGGVSVRDSLVTISAAGTYEVTGTLENGQLVVDTGDDAMEVTLIFKGVSIFNPTEAALHIRQAKNLRLQLAAGSENSLVSGTEGDLETIDPNAVGAALLSEDDLDIEGSGSLTVCGYRNNGIACKDDLDINNGNLIVVAANNGVKGNESVQIKGGSLRVTAYGDGIKSTTADKEGKGYVEISDGTVNVEAWGDGIQAATELRVSGGRLEILTRGDGNLNSSKALKAEKDVTVSGGTLVLNTQEDGIRSGTGNVSVSGGSLEICALGDGIKAGEKDSGLGDIAVSGGSITVFAGKQAAKARGQFNVTGGSLTALCGSDKQAAPLEGLPYLLCKLDGVSGDLVLIGEGSENNGLEARQDFSCVFCADGGLVSGETVTVTAGGHSTVAIVA